MLLRTNCFSKMMPRPNFIFDGQQYVEELCTKNGLFLIVLVVQILSFKRLISTKFQLIVIKIVKNVDNLVI